MDHDTGYRIVILIGVLGVHLIFWVVIVLCRTMLSGMFSRVSTRYMNGVRTLFGCQSSTSNPEASCMDTEADCTANQAPPPYEEAIKYPSISSLLTSDAASPHSVTVYDNNALNFDETTATQTSPITTCATLEVTSVTRQGRPSQEEDVSLNNMRYHTPSFTRMTRSFSCGDLQNTNSSLSSTVSQHKPQERVDFPPDSSSLEEPSHVSSSFYHVSRSQRQ